MTWIRWETSGPRHELIAQLAEELRIAPAQAFGHYVAACCGFGEFQLDGNAGAVTDTALEMWALWQGKRGRFAAAFRSRCLETREGERDSAGTLKGWWRQRALLDKQIRDAARTKPPKIPPDSPDNPPENPRGFSAGSEGYVDGNGNGTTPTTVGQRDREGEPPVPLNSPEARLIARMGRQPDRWAVWDFLEHIPDPQQIPWVHRLAGYLEGLDFPAGIRPTPEQLATACRDYEGNFSPAHFRGFVLRAIRGPRPADGPSGPRRGAAATGEAQLEAGRRWAASRGGSSA